jgi:hypothetical protein
VYFHTSRYFLLIEIALKLCFLLTGIITTGTYNPVVGSVAYACPWAVEQGSTTCQSFCLAGTYADSISECSMCSAGTYSAENATTCAVCPYASLEYDGAASCPELTMGSGGPSFLQNYVYKLAIHGTLIYATTVQGTIVVLDTSTSDVSTLYSYITEGVEYDNLFGIAVNDEAVYAFGGTLCDILVVKNGTASTYGSCNSSEFSSNTYGAITVNAGGYVFFPAEVSGVTKIAMVVIYGESYESMTFCHTDGFVSSLEVDLSTNLLYFVTPYGVYVVNITAAEEFGGLPEPELLIDIYVDQEFGFVRDFAMAPNGGMMLVATNGTYFLGPNASYSKMSTATLFGAALGSDNLFYATGYGQLHIFKGEFVK